MIKNIVAIGYRSIRLVLTIFIISIVCYQSILMANETKKINFELIQQARELYGQDGEVDKAIGSENFEENW